MPSAILNDGGNCISNARIFSSRQDIDSRKYSSSFSTSFNLLALFAGAFTIVAPEAYKKTKRKMKNDINNNKTITPSSSNFIGLERFNKK
jgi:hypothetical protein